MAAGQRLVAYERVSTARQGASGLGLEAQRKVIEDFAASRGAEVLARFTEVECGRKAEWPELGKALHLAKVTGATLIIAKLDRLSLNAAFLLALRDSGVRFVAVDMPEANDLTVGIMALVAQAEREAISRRTKEALAVAKMRGVKLGNPNGAASLRRAGKGGVALRAAVSANAAACARDLERVIDDIQASGHISLRAIAAELTTRGIRTRRGGMWGVGNVRGVLARLPAQTAFHSSDRGPFGATARADTDKQPSEPPAQNDPFRWDQRTTHFASGLHQGALHGFDPAGEKGGPDDQRGRLIRRTKGGMNTKLHAVTDAKGRSLRFFMTAGQVIDCTGAAALLGSLPAAD